MYELVKNSEDPYFELEKEHLRGVECLLGNKAWSQGFNLKLAKLDMDIG